MEMMIKTLTLKVILSVLLLCTTAFQGAAKEQVISDAVTLGTAVRAADPGTTLILAPGDYGSLILRNVSGTKGAPITLRSQDPSQPARFERLSLRNSAHIVLEGLLLDYVYTPGDPWKHPAFYIQDSQDIKLMNSVLDGDRPYDRDALSKDYGWAFGLSIRGSSDIELRGNEMFDFFRGLVVRAVDRLTIADNDIHTMRMDGMTLAQVTDTVIENNHIRDFNRSVDSGDHADMIQFWTASTGKPTRNVTIRNNILNSGKGAATQTIFMRNEMVDTGRAGPEMLYRNIRIENNVIINAHPNAIMIGETDGLIIANNTLVRNRASVGTKHRDAFYIPSIRVKHDAINVQVIRNVAPKIVEPRRTGNWTVRDNFEIQDQRTGASNHYTSVFANPLAGDPRDLRSFKYRKDSPLGQGTLGARLLDPE